jgi:hypothetical protein
LLLREQSVHHSIKPSGGLVIKPLCVLVMREVKTFGLLSISKTPYHLYLNCLRISALFAPKRRWQKQNKERTVFRK